MSSKLLSTLAVLVILCFVFIHGTKQADQFKQWFTKNGGKIDGIDVKTFPGMGNGLVATTSLNEGKRVLFVPNKLIFSLHSMQSSLDREVKLLSQHFESDLAIISWLLLEYKRKDSSFFYPYMQVLPTYVSSLLYFNSTELQELHSSTFQHDISQFQNELLSNFDLFRRLVKSVPSNTVITLLSSVTFEDFQWANTIMNSRGLRFHGEIHIAPMADLFNYQPHSLLRQANSGEFFLKHHQLNTNHDLTILADRDCMPQEQLYEDYGDNTNEIYFQYHGFIPDVNPFQCIKFDTSILTERNIIVVNDMQRQLLAKLRFRAPPVACLNSHVQTIQRPLIIYLSILSFTLEETNTCAQFVRKEPIDWSGVYRQCSFEKIVNQVEELLRESVRRINSPEEVLEEQSLQVKASLTSDVLIDRVWYMMQYLIQSTLQQSDYRITSIQEDRAFLHSTQQHLSAALAETNTLEEEKKKAQLQVSKEAADDEEEEDIDDFGIVKTSPSKTVEAGDNEDAWKGYLHQELAIKYRLMNKQIVYGLCLLVQLDDTVCNSLVYPQSKHVKKTPAGHGATAAAAGISHTDEDNSEEEEFEGEEDGVTRGTAKHHGSDDEEEDSILQQQVTRFNTWFHAHAPDVSMIEAAVIPGYRIGTIVTAEKVDLEEIYLSVPVELILSNDVAYDNPSIHSSVLLHTLHNQYKARDALHELLFFLLSETFVQGKASFYYPYIALLPTVTEMKSYLPIFWTSQDIQDYLYPSMIVFELLVSQQKHVRRYNMLSNNTEIMQYFGPAIFTYDHYVWGMGILDSRSIWWKSARHLVPMLDFINCQEQKHNSPSRVHSTFLDEHELNAITRSGDKFVKGEQLFENYGQTNHIYFTYHGFILPQNSHDCVQYGLQLSIEEYQWISKSKYHNWLQRLGIHSMDDHFMTCLSTAKVSPSVWVFLKIKLNKLPSKEDRTGATIDQPTEETVKYLIKHIEARLVLYVANQKKVDEVPSKFKVAVELVNREQSTLRDVLVSLRELLQKVSEQEKKVQGNNKTTMKGKKGKDDEEEEDEL